MQVDGRIERVTILAKDDIRDIKILSYQNRIVLGYNDAVKHIHYKSITEEELNKDEELLQWPIKIDKNNSRLFQYNIGKNLFSKDTNYSSFKDNKGNLSKNNENFIFNNREIGYWYKIIGILCIIIPLTIISHLIISNDDNIPQN